MDSSTVDIAIVTLSLAAMAGFGVLMLAVALKVGPRRGYWNQPAAKLRPTGRGMLLAMYAMAALHVALGLVAAFAVPGGGIGVLVVLVAMATFYVLCAHSWALAHAVARRRDR